MSSHGKISQFDPKCRRKQTGFLNEWFKRRVIRSSFIQGFLELNLSKSFINPKFFSFCQLAWIFLWLKSFRDFKFRWWAKTEVGYEEMTKLLILIWLLFLWFLSLWGFFIFTPSHRLGKKFFFWFLLILILIFLFSSSKFAQLAGAVEYIDCFSAEGYLPPTTSVLDMTLNNLMVRFQ